MGFLCSLYALQWWMYYTVIHVTTCYVLVLVATMVCLGDGDGDGGGRGGEFGRVANFKN